MDLNNAITLIRTNNDFLGIVDKHTEQSKSITLEELFQELRKRMGNPWIGTGKFSLLNQYQYLSSLLISIVLAKEEFYNKLPKQKFSKNIAIRFGLYDILDNKTNDIIEKYEIKNEVKNDCDGKQLKCPASLNYKDIIVRDFINDLRNGICHGNIFIGEQEFIFWNIDKYKKAFTMQIAFKDSSIVKFCDEFNRFVVRISAIEELSNKILEANSNILNEDIDSFINKEKRNFKILIESNSESTMKVRNFIKSLNYSIKKGNIRFYENDFEYEYVLGEEKKNSIKIICMLTDIIDLCKLMLIK